MSKVTESRKKILNILKDADNIPMTYQLEQIEEIVLNDKNWNETKAQENKTEVPEQEEYRSLLDIAIDLMPDESSNK